MDLVAAKRKKDINGTQPIFSLEEDMHEKIMSLAIPKSKFLILHKLEDYYSDNTILFGELKILKNELNMIIKKDIKAHALHELISFIEKAILDEDNIYIESD